MISFTSTYACIIFDQSARSIFAWRQALVAACDTNKQLTVSFLFACLFVFVSNVCIISGCFRGAFKIVFVLDGPSSSAVPVVMVCLATSAYFDWLEAN